MTDAADNPTYVKLQELVHHALVNWNHGASPDTRTTVVMQAIWPEIERLQQALKNSLARELETTVEKLDPKDVMRYDRDAYEVLYGQ